MADVFFNQFIITDPVAVLPDTGQIVDPEGETPTNVLIEPDFGFVAGNDYVEVHSYGQLRDRSRDDTLKVNFRQNWFQQGDVKITNVGTRLKSVSGVEAKIIHPTSDFQNFNVKIDFVIETITLIDQDFFILRFTDGDNFFSVSVAKRNGLNVVQGKSFIGNETNFGKVTELTSINGSLSIVKFNKNIYALINDVLIFSSDSFVETSGAIEIVSLNKSESENSTILISNFRDVAGAAISNKLLVSQRLLNDYTVSGYTARVSNSFHGIHEVNLFGRFGVLTQEEAWEYRLPTGKSLTSSSQFTASIFPNKRKR